MNEAHATTSSKSCVISVVIPVYNELAILDECFSEVCRVLDATDHSYEIVFVDDGSSDGSLERMIGFCEKHEGVVLVQHKRNYGQQKALLSGLKHSAGRAVVTFDADMQIGAECIPEMAEKILDGYDIAGGIRKGRQDHLFYNRIPSWIGNSLINKALCIRQKDFGATKAYSHKIVQEVLAMPRPNIIIPATAYSISKNFVEIPVRHEARKTGRSKWSTLQRVETYLDIYTTYARRPFEWMMISGLGSFLAGLVLGIGIILYRILGQVQFAGTIIFFDVFLLFFGIHFLSLSLIAEFIVRTYRYRGEESEMVAQILRAADKMRRG